MLLRGRRYNPSVPGRQGCRLTCPALLRQPAYVLSGMVTEVLVKKTVRGLDSSGTRSECSRVILCPYLRCIVMGDVVRSQVPSGAQCQGLSDSACGKYMGGSRRDFAAKG